MKRMYVVLTVLFLLILGVVSTCLAQFSTPKTTQSADPTFDRMKRRMELREEMHRRMIEKLLRGIGPDQDMFKDMEQMFEDSMQDSFSGFDSITETRSVAFSNEWVESTRGRSLVITPKDPKQQLDIDIKNAIVTIKGKTEVKDGNSSFTSNFSNSFTVPEDCDPDKVNTLQKDGKIILEFPFREIKNVVSPKKDERRPLPKAEGAVEI